MVVLALKGDNSEPVALPDKLDFVSFTFNDRGHHEPEYERPARSRHLQPQ
jgi:hypothetical protein